MSGSLFGGGGVIRLSLVLMEICRDIRVELRRCSSVDEFIGSVSVVDDELL